MKTKFTALTHVDKARQMSVTQMEQICRYLGWTEDQYCEFQFTCYQVFLSTLFSGFPESRREVEYSPIMAGFWKNQWMRRNRTEFLPCAEDLCESSIFIDSRGKLVYYQPADDARQQAEDEYIFIHCPERLMNDEDFMTQHYHTLKLIIQSNK